MQPNFAEKLPPALRGRLGLVLAGVIGTSLSLAIAAYLHLTEAAQIRLEIERRVSLRHDLLAQGLREYDSALYALRLLVENSEDFTPAEFKRAAKETLGRVAGIQAVQWVVDASREELPALVAHARQVLGSDFTLRHRLADGSVVALAPEQAPAGRERFCIIAYVHPLPGNEITHGYDILTGPTAEDLAVAKSAPGRIILTRAVHLVQGGEGIVLTTYVADRQEPALPPPLGGPGYLQIVLRLDTMLNEAWNIAVHPILDVLLADVTTSPVQLFAQIGDTRLPATLNPPPPDFVTANTLIRDLHLGGRLWRVYYRPRADWMRERRGLAPFFSLFGGGLLTLLSIVHLDTLRRQTELVRREVADRTAQLADSRALLHSIIDHNPSIIWVKDASYRYQLVNLAFAECYGRSRDDLLGLTDDLIHPPEAVQRMQAQDARILATGETESFEDVLEVADRRRIFIVSKFPLRRADGAIYAVAGIATDITNLREAEEAHRKFERKLLETQKLESLGILAGGVAHDFNNLLTGILGHAGLARAQLPPGDPAHDSLARIETAAHRAADLCRQMLAYAGRGRLTVQPIDLGELARDTTNLLKLSLARRARLRFDLAPGLPRVVADPVQIRQIIMNLVLNASEALVDGEGEITISTRVVRGDAALFATCVFSPDLPPGDYASIEISDNGKGMDAETVARIFDPFFSTKFTGRGLGLAAVLGIVRGHAGALQVKSRPGAGTTFRLFLPVAPVVGAGAVAASAAQAPGGASGPVPPRLRILLVDDDPAIRDTTPSLLGTRGHSVDACADGESGLQRLRAAPRDYDLAIIDLTMPGLGGARLLERIDVLRPDLPVLLISGYTNQDSAAADLLRRPRVAFLAKPFTLPELEAAIASLLRPAPANRRQVS